MLMLFIKASKYIFLYFFPFNNECRSDLRNSPSVLGIFWALLMIVEHATSTPSSFLSTTNSPIRLVPLHQPSLKSEVMHELSFSEQPPLDVHAEIIGIPKGRDWGYSLGVNFCWWPYSTEVRWWVFLHEYPVVPHLIIHANSTTTTSLTLHPNSPLGRATLEWWSFNVDFQDDDAHTTTIHHHHLSPMTVTAHHYRHNGHASPPPTDGDEPQHRLLAAPCLPSTMARSMSDVREVGNARYHHHHKGRLAPISSIRWAELIPFLPFP